MERGLLWLPLLGVFFWLTWSGWNEYQKLEAYKVWAEDFDQAKFDIYAVLGVKDSLITWGKPTRQGMQNLQSFELNEVNNINLLVNGNPVNLENLPAKGQATLRFDLNHQQTQEIPFTDIALAAKWYQFLVQIPAAQANN